MGAKTPIELSLKFAPVTLVQPFGRAVSRARAVLLAPRLDAIDATAVAARAAGCRWLGRDFAISIVCRREPAL